MRDYVVQKLGMAGCCNVSESPNKPNICYEVVRKTSIEEDFAFVIADLLEKNIKVRRIVVYCQTLNMCASLYEHSKYTLKDAGYYPLELNKSVTIECLGCSTPVQMSTTKQL